VAKVVIMGFTAHSGFTVVYTARSGVVSPLVSQHARSGVAMMTGFAVPSDGL
jgi:hypothetical protein